MRQEYNLDSPTLQQKEVINLLHPTIYENDSMEELNLNKLSGRSSFKVSKSKLGGFIKVQVSENSAVKMNSLTPSEKGRRGLKNQNPSKFIRKRRRKFHRAIPGNLTSTEFYTRNLRENRQKRRQTLNFTNYSVDKLMNTTNYQQPKLVSHDQAYKHSVNESIKKVIKNCYGYGTKADTRFARDHRDGIRKTTAKRLGRKPKFDDNIIFILRRLLILDYQKYYIKGTSIPKPEMMDD